jgi:lipoprotein-releasing system permease protein
MKRLHWDIALRQATDSGQGLSAFLSRLSVLGMIIAVSVLLAALSVMNGFEREMRVRILSLVPHVTIRGYADEIEWGQIQSDLVELSSVLRTVRFTDLDAMLTADGQAQVIRLAIADSQVLPVYESYLAPPISSLRANEVILGSALASSLGVRVGDRVSALYSVGAVGNRLVPGGLSVVSILDSETEIDQIFALAGPNSGKLNQLELGSGLSLTLSDPLVAARLSSQLKVALAPNFWVTDWTSSQGNLYQAIELSRRNCHIDACFTLDYSDVQRCDLIGVGGLGQASLIVNATCNGLNGRRHCTHFYHPRRDNRCRWRWLGCIVWLYIGELDAVSCFRHGGVHG